MSDDRYAVRLEIDYPDRELNRLSTFFRIPAVIPIVFVLALVNEGTNYASGDKVIGAGGVLIAAPALMILFRRKYPRWWFDWNLELSRFVIRVISYLALMNDEYPSTDEQQSVHLEIDYPDAENDLSRGLPLVKWLLAVPHWIVVGILYLVALIAVAGAWVAILLTGRYPRGIFDFVLGVERWTMRVIGYALLLVTDEYPPFRLEA